MRVVIAEDDTAVAEGLAGYLRKAGHEVAVALDGEKALRHLQSGPTDLLILDYDLPRVHGAQVLQVVRERTEHLPVLLFTALDEAEARLAQQALYVDAVLAKPFGLADFEKCLRRLQHPHGGPHQSAEPPLALADDERYVLGLLKCGAQEPWGRDEIASRLGERGIVVTPEAVERCIERLREKLAAHSLQIVKVRGLGYLLLESAAPSLPSATV